MPRGQSATGQNATGQNATGKRPPDKMPPDIMSLDKASPIELSQDKTAKTDKTVKVAGN